MRFKKGVVVSTKMAKTVVVKVDTSKTHKKYMKKITKSKKYYADTDDNSKYNLWDIITIMEIRPISKLKCWKVVSWDELVNNK